MKNCVNDGLYQNQQPTGWPQTMSALGKDLRMLADRLQTLNCAWSVVSATMVGVTDGDNFLLVSGVLVGLLVQLASLEHSKQKASTCGEVVVSGSGQALGLFTRKKHHFLLSYGRG